MKEGKEAGGEIISRLSAYIANSGEAELPAVLAIRERITLVGDTELRMARIKRGGIVEITIRDGSQFREHVELVRGRSANPMSDEEIVQKCTDLMRPVLGEDRTKNLIDQIWNLEKVRNMRDLRPLLSVPRPPGWSVLPVLPRVVL